MSASVNVVVIVGNLTRDPELRQAGEYAICQLGVAVNERVKQNGEYVERANFFDVDVWGKMGENCGTTESIHGHHDDYAKPLDVRWLCRLHHMLLHGQLRLDTEVAP